MSLRNIFLTYFFIDEIIMIFLMTDILFLYWGVVVVYKNLEFDGFDLPNLV